MISKIVNAFWLIFSIGALASLVSAPILWNSSDSNSVLPSFVAAGVFVGLLLLMGLATMWVEGSKANPTILSGIFAGLLLAGTGIWLMSSAELGMVAAAIGISGLVVTGLIVEATKAKSSVHH